MRTLSDIHDVLNQFKFSEINAHVHTHLCDGKSDMTVANIAACAERLGIRLIVLTPHFHKKVSDATATLYEDTDEAIFLRLREEIDVYQKKPDSRVKFLLSTETDILNVNGDLSLKISKEAEDAIDFITMAVNYHPLLPLKAVEVTSSRSIAQIHDSGEYLSYVNKIGTISDVLETLYETEVNAIQKAPYPAMLGHFFAAHSIVKGKYNWFGASKEHMALMKKGSERIISVCKKTGTIVDITGIHCGNKSIAEKSMEDGFFYDFQKWFVNECRKKKITMVPGGDTHSLDNLSGSLYYKIFERKKRDDTL